MTLEAFLFVELNQEFAKIEFFLTKSNFNLEFRGYDDKLLRYVKLSCILHYFNYKIFNIKIAFDPARRGRAETITLQYTPASTT